jgi:hypothetical protein
VCLAPHHGTNLYRAIHPLQSRWASKENQGNPLIGIACIQKQEADGKIVSGVNVFEGLQEGARLSCSSLALSLYDPRLRPSEQYGIQVMILQTQVIIAFDLIGGFWVTCA